MKLCYLSSVFVYILILITACNHEKVGNESSIADHKSEPEKLITFSPQSHPSDTVELIREAFFESTEEVFMEGYISRMAVDDRDRVYIAATRPGSVGIFVFNPDGSYLTRFGQEGRGPGEYESIGSIAISNHQLYVFDPRLQKFGIFSLDDFSHIKDEIIIRDEVRYRDSLATRLRGDQLYVAGDGELLLRLRMIPRNKETDIPKKMYYRVSERGELLPGSVLNVERFSYYFPEGQLEVPYPMPFTRSSLVSIGRDGRLFTAWTEDFLVKVYDQAGNYERAFSYPVKKSPLSLEEFEISRERQRNLDQYEIPETWPALHTMELDDEGHLWVAIITDSDSTFQWWVLDENGELLARFTKPGTRSSRPVVSKPLILIKNGYFYSHVRDFREGIDRIIKHRIDWKRR